MAQRAGRITCPRCGSNNFDTVTSCWKCGAPVGAAAMAASPASAPPVSQPQAGYAQERALGAVAFSPAAPPVYSAPAATGDAGVARRAAILLGLTIPFVGLPVG